MRLGVIGGTGLYDWGPDGEPITIETEHGDVEAVHHRIGRSEIVFIARHGRRHEVPPHRVNHRANVRALSAAKVDCALGVFNVGGLDPSLRVGAWVAPVDFIDATGTTHTFFHESAVHVDLAQPYCPTLRGHLTSFAPKPIVDTGVYASVAGPRFETAREAVVLKAQGATVVGMTGGPEATLMREAHLHYAALAFVGNAAGESVDAQTVQRRLAREAGHVRSWVSRAVGTGPTRWACACVERGRARPLVGGVAA